MKKKILAVAMAACMVLSVAACGQKKEATGTQEQSTVAAAPAGETIKVGVINNMPSESGYRTANDADLRATFTKENGYDATFVNKDNNADMITEAKKMITDGVDYLLLSAAESAGWDETLKEAQKQGVKVICFDRKLDCSEDLYEAAIISDMDKEGETAVNWLKDQKLDKYDIVSIQGQPGSAAALGRQKALTAQCDADANWTLVGDTASEKWDEKDAETYVESLIAKGTKFNVIYAHNDGLAKGAVAALDAHNITHGVGKDVIVMGFDCNKFALRELQAGNWNYDGQCNPFQASYIVDVIKKLEAGEKLADKTIIMTELGFDATKITEDDITKYGLGEDPGVLKK